MIQHMIKKKADPIIEASLPTGHPVQQQLSGAIQN
jgi:hypothetical protein